MGSVFTKPFQSTFNCQPSFRVSRLLQYSTTQKHKTRLKHVRHTYWQRLLSTNGFCFQKTFALASHLILCMKSQLTTNKEYIQNGYQMFDFRRISSLHILHEHKKQNFSHFDQNMTIIFLLLFDS